MHHTPRHTHHLHKHHKKKHVITSATNIVLACMFVLFGLYAMFFVNKNFGLTFSQIQALITPTPTPVLPWKTYNDPLYTISYPPNQTTTASPTSVNFAPMGVTIRHTLIGSESLRAHLAVNSTCTEIKPEKGKAAILDRAPGLIFLDTKCVPGGLTEIDVVRNGTLYTILTPRFTTDVKKMVSTFRFAK